MGVASPANDRCSVGLQGASEGMENIAERGFYLEKKRAANKADGEKQPSPRATQLQPCWSSGNTHILMVCVREQGVRTSACFKCTIKHHMEEETMPSGSSI